MINRRKFLSQATTGMSLAALSAMLKPTISYCQVNTSGKIRHIVIPFLRGGMDVNSAYPFTYIDGQPIPEPVNILQAKRPNIYPKMTANGSLLPLTSYLAFHPLNSQSGYKRAFHPEFSELFQTKNEFNFGVNLVRGVGNTNLSKLSLSHQIAQDQYDVGTGESPTGYREGWLARLIDSAGMTTGRVWGLSVPNRLSYAVSNPANSPIVLSSLSGYSRWQNGLSGTSYNCTQCTGVERIQDENDDRAFENEVLQRLANASGSQGALSEQFKNVVGAINPVWDEIASIKAYVPSGYSEQQFQDLFKRKYPTNAPGTSVDETPWQRLAMDLARVIGYNEQRYATGTFIYTCDLGGWDHHNGITYYMGVNIKYLSLFLSGLLRGVNASGCSQKTVIAVCSEFGRTIEENGSGGVDHGGASAMLIVGGPVKNEISGDPENSLVAELQDNARKNYVTPVIPFTSVFKSLLKEGAFSSSHLNAAFPFVMPNEQNLSLII